MQHHRLPPTLYVKIAQIPIKFNSHLYKTFPCLTSLHTVYVCHITLSNYLFSFPLAREVYVNTSI